MFGKKKGFGNIVHVNDIHDIDLKSITPADLNKTYIDRNGQEWKIRYNTKRDVIQLVRLIHERLGVHE